MQLNIHPCSNFTVVWLLFENRTQSTRADGFPSPEFLEDMVFFTRFFSPILFKVHLQLKYLCVFKVGAKRVIIFLTTKQRTNGLCSLRHSPEDRCSRFVSNLHWLLWAFVHVPDGPLRRSNSASGWILS